MMTAAQRGFARWDVALLWVPGIAVALAAIAPLWYLWVRSTERGWAGWQETVERVGLELIINSGALVAGVSICSLVIALPAAWLVTRTDLPFRRAWTVFLAAPLAMPSYVMALTVVAALGPRGMLQGWLEPLGVDRLPEVYGYAGATFALTAVSFPYLFLVLRSALAASDPFVGEASRSLGAGPWRTFFRVTAPPLRPAIAAGILLVALYSLSDFGAVAILRFDTFTRVIFIEYSSSFDRTGAAVLGFVLVALAVPILTGEYIARSRYRLRVTTKRQAPSPPLALGRWRWPALCFLTTVVLISLVLPVAVLVYWLINGVQAGTTFSPVVTPLLHSITLAVIAAVATVFVGLPLAILSARLGGRPARLLEQLAFSTHALPGIVVALALVFIGIEYFRPLYQTLWMLIAAYVILFLPNALAALRSPLLRQNPHLEEAAAALGRRPLASLFTVTLPLARPGVIAGAALVFLTTMKELPATLLLSPPGYQTLAGSVWGAGNNAMFGSAALPALVLLATSAIPVALLAWRGDIDSIES